MLSFFQISNILNDGQISNSRFLVQLKWEPSLSGVSEETTDNIAVSSEEYLQKSLKMLNPESLWMKVICICSHNTASLETMQIYWYV